MQFARHASDIPADYGQRQQIEGGEISSGETESNPLFILSNFFP
jgi:hypothetical protein